MGGQGSIGFSVTCEHILAIVVPLQRFICLLSIARLFLNPIKYCLASDGQPVFLSAASWLVRDGHFDEPGCQGRLQVALPEVCLAFEPEVRLQFGPVHRAGQCFEEPLDFTCYFACHFTCELLTGGQDGVQKKFDERGGIAGLVAGAEGSVILGLAVADDGLDGNHEKDRPPAPQDQLLPEAAQPAVAIHERVNKLELVMEHGAGNERMRGGRFEPSQQLIQQVRNSLCRRGNMNDFFPALNADTASPQ